jgi:hypothetical protein
MCDIYTRYHDRIEISEAVLTLASWSELTAIWEERYYLHVIWILNSRNDVSMR